MSIIGTMLGSHRPTVNVLLEPTNDCQLRCVTCYRLGGRSVGYMTMDTFRLALSHLPLTTLHVSLSGAGESLLHPEFIKMIDLINSTRNWFGMKYITGFSTNGLLFDSRMQDNIIDKVDWINISLDDGLGKSYDKRRPGSNWSIVSDNAQEFIDRSRNRTKAYVSLTRLHHLN